MRRSRMARADLLLDLVEAERRGDRDRFRVLVEAVIAEERANQHHLLADRLSELITTTGRGMSVTIVPQRFATWCGRSCRTVA